ncbi:lysophospholipid acyltransferase family protein [Actibacterium pelagium]|uniref:Lipid A biosynthesis lauroyl acyltransferase n=1 Tax=Actibacterium pelagium TaxID=2029103 RepID=A0A917AC16_9RHOB|nr:lysophospholipid acyltransferase family protein [Actibacterium pelagium]GGE40255.1 lipid A biosynthesis lauroyl acyltransferase [Actibacterium pelagium]
MAASSPSENTFGNWISDRVARGLIRLALSIPYEMRVRLFGKLMRYVIAPIAGYRKRALANLDLIYPDMIKAEKLRIANAACDNAGRSLIENYSAKEFIERMKSVEVSGPGLDHLRRAQEANQPVLLVSGHFGNYESVRAALMLGGFEVGCLYRPMRNPYFNKHYVNTLEHMGGPAFPQGKRGMMGLVKHLKSGGILAMLNDLHKGRGARLTFMGKPAKTATTGAEMALKYNALVIPFYGTRLENGLDFKVELEEPIPATDAETMTQAMNDNLQARVEKSPEQWFWIHRRWKDKGKKALSN